MRKDDASCEKGGFNYLRFRYHIGRSVFDDVNEYRRRSPVS